MAKQISFIHAADLHLDSPFQGLSSAPESIFSDIQASTFQALEELVRVAIEKQVDFVLLVGDLFDNDRQSLKAQIQLRTAFEKLADVNIDVFLSFGNHDYIQGNVHAVSYPDNVFVFPNEHISSYTYMKDDQKLAQIYGFSYEQRAITENKASEYQITDESIPFHIATLHGSLRHNQDHDVYAPFQIRDLLQESFNYWALGHIHKRQILKEDPPIVYPGNIQGRHRKETGTKGCYYVTMTETEKQLSFVPLQAIEFTTLSIDVTNCKDLYDVKEEMETAIKAKSPSTPMLIDLHITGHEHLETWDMQSYLEDVVDIIHETTTAQKNWQYIFSLSIHENTPMESLVGDHFVSQLIEQFDDLDVRPFLNDLYNHRQGRKYLTSLSTEEQQLLTQEAKHLLINKLLKKDG